MLHNNIIYVRVFQKHIAIGSDKQSCYECNNSMIRLTYKEVVYDLVDNLMITRGILKRSEILLRRFRCHRSSFGSMVYIQSGPLDYVRASHVRSKLGLRFKLASSLSNNASLS